MGSNATTRAVHGLLASLTAATLACSPAPHAPPPAPAPACADGQRLLTDGGCVPDTACPPLFVSNALGAGCVELRASAECAPGSRPRLGDTSCAPVGWTSCTDGFQPADGGWGCTAITAPSGCDAGFLERLGHLDCAPLGRCDDPFPPPEATVFVDSTGLGANHYGSLAAAVAAAPAGATIAVDTGRYTIQADLELTKPVRLIGRCAASVTIAREGAGIAGVGVNHPIEVFVSRLSFEGLDAVFLTSGARVTLEDVDLRQPRWHGVTAEGVNTALTLRRVHVADIEPVNGGLAGLGVSVDDGATGTLEDVVIERFHFNGVYVRGAGASVSANGLIVRDGHPTSTVPTAIGMTVAGGAAATLTRCAFDRSLGVTLDVAGAGSDLRVEACELSRSIAVTLPTGTPVPGGELFADVGTHVFASSVVARGSAAFVRDVGAQVEIEHSVFRDAAGGSNFGMTVSDRGTLRLSDTVVVNAISAAIGAAGATASLSNVLVTDTRLDSRQVYGVGLQAFDGANVTIDDSTFLRNHTVGVLSVGSSDAGAPSRVTLKRTLVLDTKTDGFGTAGHGVNANSGASLELSQVAISGSREAGLSVQGSTGVIRDSVVRGTTKTDTGEFGHGVAVIAEDLVMPFGPATLELSRVSISSNDGVGLFVSGSAAGVEDSVFDGNATALHAQSGTGLAEVDALPSPLAPNQLDVQRDTVFWNNAVRLGQGTLPVPPPPGAH